MSNDRGVVLLDEEIRTQPFDAIAPLLHAGIITPAQARSMMYGCPDDTQIIEGFVVPDTFLPFYSTPDCPRLDNPPGGHAIMLSASIFRPPAPQPVYRLTKRRKAAKAARKARKIRRKTDRG